MAQDASFKNAQNGGSDFRLGVASAEIFVRRVTVTRLGKDETLGRDFSKTNAVSLCLGDPEKETGNGLEHLYSEPDGQTTATNLAGVPCRHLHMKGVQGGFLYFTLDPTFKKANANKVRIDVECLASRTNALNLEFDASGWLRSTRMAFSQAGPTVRLTNAARGKPSPSRRKTPPLKTPRMAVRIFAWVWPRRNYSCGV